MAGLLALAALVAGGGWSAHRVLSVRDHLEVTHGALLRLRAVVEEGDPAAVAGSLGEARRSAAEARRLTGGLDWSLFAHLPVVGAGAMVVRGLAETADELTQVLDVVQGVGTSLAAVDLHSVSDLRRPLAVLDAAGPALEGAAARLTQARSRLAATPAGTGVAMLDQARATALREMDRLRGWLDTAVTAAALLPPMLGRDGPRRYFLAFQTNAEARGTGGLVGAFGIMEAARGRIGVKRLASNADIDTTSAPVVDLGGAYLARYGPGATRMLSVSNLSPHFPYAAAIWTGMWERQTGQRLDGAVATDPVGLAHLLRLIGPVTLPSGEKVTSDNVVDLTERTSYARFPDPMARKRFLITVAAAVSDAMSESLKRPARLLPVLSRMVEERRIQIWSRREAEEQRLSATPLGGVLPRSPGPFAGLVINNSGGNKLDYYLERSLEYDLGPCADGFRNSRVRIRLSNEVPSRTLPSYVTSRLDSPERPHAIGSNLLWVSLYAGVDAKLSAAWLDGDRVAVGVEREMSHPVYTKMLEIRPRQSRTLVFDLVEPYSKASPLVPVQPLARPQQTRITRSPRGCTS